MKATEFSLSAMPKESSISQLEEWIKQNQAKIFGFYLRDPSLVGDKPIRSPLRQDRHPSCAFFWADSGELLLHDFALHKTYNCVYLVTQLFKESRALSLSRIEKDRFLISAMDELTFMKSEEKEITFIPTKVARHIPYFAKFNISEATLKKYNVFDASVAFVDGKLVWRGSDVNPIVAYIIDTKIKLYRPFEKDRQKKWMTNCKIQNVQGYNQLKRRGKVLIMTSSLKDVMVLHEMGFSAIALSSEVVSTKKGSPSYTFIKSLIEALRHRFDHILLFLDSDTAGITAAKKMSTAYDIPYVHLPPLKAKDPSDFVLQEGYKKAKKQIKKLISNAVIDAQSRASRMVTDHSGHYSSATNSSSNIQDIQLSDIPY